MRLETRVCLDDLLRACELIQSAVAGLTVEEFLSQGEKQSAVERQFMIVGEAIVRIRQLEPPVYESIPDGHAIIGFRNVLVHGYDVADPKAVFELAGLPVRDLIILVREMLDR